MIKRNFKIQKNTLIKVESTSKPATIRSDHKSKRNTLLIVESTSKQT